LGDRADVPRLLAAADVFVLCSAQEALGLALLEAMACRVPVVATAAGGMVETLVDGESGLFAPPQPEAIAERVLALLEDPARARAGTLSQVAAWAAGRAALPPRCVALTFDDAYACVFEHAAPVLRGLGWPATVFVVTGRIGGWNEWDAPRGIARAALMDAGQI